MPFHPKGYDYRSGAAARFLLAKINTVDGDFHFIVGTDGVFTDVNGQEWTGSKLFNAGSLGFGLNGAAKASTVSVTYFYDPSPMPGEKDLSEQVRALGADYVKGRLLTFYKQPFATLDEMYAPVFPPQQIGQLTMSHINYDAPSPLVRVISIQLEGAFKVRGGSRGFVYNQDDHSAQLGTRNPSYEFIPIEAREELSFLS